MCGFSVMDISSQRAARVPPLPAGGRWLNCRPSLQAAGAVRPESVVSFWTVALSCWRSCSAALNSRQDQPRLRHRFNSLILTEALIVGFLALTENAHYAVKPCLPSSLRWAASSITWPRSPR